jgi:23S rRNA pseudouridine1911/1915/1917 synthase
LDKDTSGILVVAKNAGAQAHLAAQFAARTVCKVYLAVVLGNVTPESGVISLPVGRHPVDRKRMATTGRRLRAAETRWKVRERFDGLTLVELNLKTGRTHQARVHCAAIHHAIVGDPVYGGRKAFKSIAEDPRALIRRVKRQMLHARQLTFVHPRRLVPVSFEAPLADDMAQLISRLRRLSTPSA